MGLIYGIHCRIEIDDIYVGSSENDETYEYRQKCHKSKQNICSSKIIIARGDYYFQIIEENDLQGVELRKREQYWIEKCNAINHNRAYVSEEEKKEYHRQYSETNKEQIKEYYEKHKEKIKERSNEYYKNHKEEKKEYYKEYYEKNKERERSRHKEHYKKHKEEKKEYYGEYYETHKKEMKEYGIEYYEKHKEKLNNGVQARYAYKCSMGGLSDIKMDLFH